MSKAGYYAERARKKELESKGYTVFRVSGSIGAMDLIVIKKIETPMIFTQVFDVWLEQVKSTINKTFYFDERSRYEWRRLYDLKEKHIRSIFSVMFKRKGWVFVDVNTPEPPKNIKFK